MEILFIILFIVVLIGGFAYSSYLAKKRREAMAALAAELGLEFRPARDYGLASRFGFLNKLAQGSNRYAYNVLTGIYRGHPVWIFDYHYETHSTDSKGRRRTHHHHFSFFVLKLPKSFPELIIMREGFLSKIAQFMGFDDIDFESAEFSRRFLVRSPDKKFAYDICHARMIEYLLDNQDLQIEFEHDSLGLFFGSCLAADSIRSNLERLVKIRELIPDYVLTDR